MAAKSQKQTVSTVVVTSPLATAFLNIADNRKIETHEIDGLGSVGLKELSVGLRDEWAEVEKDSSIWLVKSTVCDPATGELVLKQIDTERLKEMPTIILEKLLELIFKQNGFRKVNAVINASESTELKNSEASQN